MPLPDDIWNCLRKHLFPISSCPITGLFNHYSSIEPSMDRPGAAGTRRMNLRRYVDCFVRQPRFLLVGEAPGWRGCRFSGVPFTSEEQLISGILPFTGLQSSSSTQPFSENSANRVWEILGPMHPDIFIWNAVPLHPHTAGNYSCNRKPTAKERNRFAPMIDELVGILRPQAVVAVGRVAQAGLKKHNPIYIRHPSFGGTTSFRNGVSSLRKVRAL